MRLQDKACIFASGALTAVGKLREYTNEPCIAHAHRVANTVAAYGGTDEEIAAAYLIGVVEHTKVTCADIEGMFGEVTYRILNGIVLIRDVAKSSSEMHIEIEQNYIQETCVSAQSVTCAEIIDTSNDIFVSSLENWASYKRDMTFILKSLSKVQGTPIWNAAVESLNQHY